MSLVGFDVGNENCIVSVAQQRQNRNLVVSVAPNEESDVESPALVAFNKRRFIGINFSTINPKNVVSQIKRLIGLHDCDPQDLRRLPYDITKAANGSLLIHVDYLGESMPFSPTHILGMILGSLKSTAERALEMDVADCVIGIPAFFPEIQRRAVLDAAAIAGLRPLQLMHETTASALVYGINRIDLPENEPIHVVFVDVGHASTQISVVAFKKGQLQVLAHVFDRSLGGRDFDEVLFEHFCKKLKQQYQSNLKACQRLRAECEELKIGLNRRGRVSYFFGIDGTDVSGSMKREEFEKLSQPLLERVSKLSKGALLEANIPPERIYAVEVVGSGSRVPAISKFLSAVFKKEPSRSMNTRECVSQGCTLRCAMLSSATFRGRPEFEVQDVLPFSISLAWEGSGPDPEGGVPPTGDQSCSIIFPEGNPIPSTKMLTFYRSGTFTLGAVYTDMHNLPLGTHQKINAFTIGPFQTKRAETAKINVKVHLDLHGIVSIASAIMIEEEKVEFIPTSEEVVGGMTQADLQRAIGKEYEMAMHDLAMKEAEDSKNALEKYAYEMLSQMYEQYEAYTTDTEKVVLITELQDTQDWLKGFSDELKDVYAAKLAELEQHLDPIEERLKEDEARGFYIDQLLHCINRYQKDATLEDPKFDHIHSSDKDKVIEECKKVEKWLEDKMEQQDQLLRSENPVFHCADIKTNLEALQRFCEHIMLQPRRHVTGGNPNAAAEQKKKDQSIMMEEQKAEHNDARVTSIYPIRVIDVEATLKQHDEHGGVVFSRPTSWEFHTISHTWSKGVQCWSNMVDAKLSTSTETSQSTYEGVFMSTDFRSQACYAPFIQFLGLLNADGVKHVWLDALCINQAREAGEKAQELQRMGSYYSQSAGCYVCAHGFGEGFKTFTCRSEDPDEPKGVFLPRWFSRVWTFQEFILPQSLSFVFSLGFRRKFVITQILHREGKLARKPCSCAASRRPPGSPDIQDDEIEIDPDSLRDYSDTFDTGEEKPDLYKQMNPNLQQAKFPSPCNRCRGSRSIRLAHRVVPSDARFNLYFIDRYSFLEVWAHSEEMALTRNMPKGTDIQFKLLRLDSFLDQQDYLMKMDTSNKNIVTVDIDHSNLVIPKDEDGSTQSNRRTGSSGSGLRQHLDPVQVVAEVARRNCTRDEDRVLSVLGLLGIEGAVQLRNGKPLKDQLLDLAKRMARSPSKRLHTLLVQLCIAEFAGSTTPGMSWAPSMMKRPIKDLNRRDNIELYEAARRAALEIEQHTEVCLSQMGQILMYMRKSVEVENVLDDGTLIFAKARALHDCIFTRQGDVFNLHIMSNSAQNASSSHSTSLSSTAAPLIHDSVTGDMTDTFKYIYPFQAHVTSSSYLLINQITYAGPVISSTRVATMSVVSLPPRQDHYSHLKQFKVHLVLLGQICLPCNTELEVMMICVGDKLGKLHKVGIGWIPGLKSILLKTPVSKCTIGGFEDFMDRFVLL